MAPFYRAPPPIPVLGWTGPYVGATLGGGWTDSHVTETAIGTGAPGLVAASRARSAVTLDTSSALVGPRFEPPEAVAS